ncbi:MAG: MFS transporter [Thermoprotei archaeon]
MERANPRRWGILFGFTLISMSSQIIWLNFAGIVSPQTQDIYHVGLGLIGLLSAVWPLVFIPLSIPVGLLVDRWGFRKVVILGGTIFMVFSWLRIISGTNFWVLFVFQSLASIGQPFIYNSISKLSRDWFPAGEQTLANGIGTMGQIVGMVIALTVVPIMVPNAVYAELRNNFLVVSALTTASLIVFLVFAREKSTIGSGCKTDAQGNLSQIKSLLALRNIVILMVLFFIGVGVFSAFTQWVEAILYSRGEPPLYGGLTGAIMLISGIVGMVVVSLLADRSRRLKPIITVNTLIAAFSLFLFSFRVNLTYYIVISILLGFFLLSLAPVGLQLSAESVGEERAGTAAGLVWLASQVGALFFILLLPAVGAAQAASGYMLTNPWFLPVISMAVPTMAAFAISFAISEVNKNAKSSKTHKQR